MSCVERLCGLELDFAPGEDSFLVGVLDLAHLGDGVGEFDEKWVGVAAGEDDVDAFGFLPEDVGDLFGREHVVADGVVDLVEDDEVPIAGEDGGSGFAPRLFDETEVFGVGLGSSDLDEAAAHLADGAGGILRGSEGGDGVELAMVPGALEELQDEDTHSVAGGTEGGPDGGGGLSLAGAGVDEDESATRDFGHED